MRRIATIISTLLFIIGTASLGATLYLWFGDWPQQVKEVVDHERSKAATEHQPPPPLIGNVAGRTTRSLDGRWKALPDPNRSMLGNLFGTIARDVHAKSEAELVEFSFENGFELEVPGDWNSQDERLIFYNATVWYKRTFEYEREPGRRVFLHFGASNYTTSVYLNGERVGKHVGGYSPFNFEVTDTLREGVNLLVIDVDSRQSDEDIPTPRTDWMNYGGLTRSVNLVEVPETFIRAYHVQLASGRSDRIHGWVELDGARASQDVTISIADLAAEVTTRSDASGRAEFELDARPELWSPDSPRLHTVEIRSETDAVEEKIGFRTIEVQGREILLNAESIFLRGISLHEEAGFGRGRAHSREDAHYLLGLARELGCNFVRLAHYPHNEAIVRAADELGFLVWSEIPVYWDVDFGNPYTVALGKQQLTEMIERDRNRAAVILWSLGNETPIDDDRNAFFRTLADHARALDPTRPLAAAILAGPELLGPVFAKAVIPAALGIGPEEWVMNLDGDPLAEIVDVPSLNQYWGWYYSTPLAAMTPFTAFETRKTVIENLHRLRFSMRAEKPLVISELGAGAKQGRHRDAEQLSVFSEEYQALVYEKQVEMLSLQDRVAVRGMAPWILKDFRSTMRLYQGLQDYWNLKGLVSDDGQKKLAFGVLRDHYRALAEQ